FAVVSRTKCVKGLCPGRKPMPGFCPAGNGVSRACGLHRLWFYSFYQVPCSIPLQFEETSFRSVAGAPLPEPAYPFAARRVFLLVRDIAPYTEHFDEPHA